MTTYGDGNENVSFPDVTVCNLYPMNDKIGNLTWFEYIEYIEGMKDKVTLEFLNATYCGNPDTVEFCKFLEKISQDTVNYFWNWFKTGEKYFVNFPIVNEVKNFTDQNLVIGPTYH